MAIAIRNQKEIEGIRKACALAAEALRFSCDLAKPGISTLEIAQKAEDYIVTRGGKASFKGLYGFPGSICISINEIIIHGIPDNKVLQEGDIVGIDIGVELDGWFGDTAITIPVGKISDEDAKILACAKDALALAIDSIEEGMRFKKLSGIIEDFIVSHGYAPLKNFCGHGIGRRPHEEPQILNYVEGSPTQGPKIKNGMVFCIEPMICAKNGDAVILDDKWSVTAKDGLRGSHYEHTVAIIDGRAVILTQ